MFTWYIYTSGSGTFNTILGFGENVYRQLGDFFNPASRGETVLTGLGLSEAPSAWNTISRVISYLTQALIVLGFIGLMTRRTSLQIKNEYFDFTVVSMVFLFVLILVPGLANTFNMTRFYHILLFFLSPLCVVGAEFVVKLWSKQKREFAISVLLLLVLVPYFLFQTEFVFEVAGADSWSIALSGYRMNALRLYGQYGYPDAQSVFGAQWLSRNADVRNMTLYGDQRTLINVLIMYSMVREGNSLSNTTVVADNGVVYLSRLNVIHGKIPYGRFVWNTSQLSFIFDNLNLIYSDGGSKIYQRSP